MSNPIVLAFDTEGTIEYTRNSQFTPWEGRGEMVRVTDIRKKPDANEFYIHWMQGPYAGVDHTYGMSAAAGVIIDSAVMLTKDEVMTFPTYEAAVDHEVAVLNAYRRQGVSFNDKTS